MNHAITIGGLLHVVGALAGILLFAFGLLAIAALSMSDAPEDGDSKGILGCFFIVGGIALFVGCVLGLVL